MEPLAVITTVGVIGVVVKAIVDGLRRHYPKLDGLWPQLIALTLGAGIAWAFDLRGAEALLEYVGGAAGRTPIVAVDYLVTGAAIAAGAGFLAEISSRGKAGTAVIEVDDEGRPVY